MRYLSIQKIAKRRRELWKDASGLALVEFAILFPVIIVLSLGVMEFGMWFYESEITTSSLSNISQAIENNPNITTTQLQQMVNVSNDGLKRLSFTNGSNYICVKAYSTATAAQTGGCKKGDLSAANPSPGSAYAVAVQAYVAPNPLTPLGNFVHGLHPTATGMVENMVLTVNNLVPPKKCVNTSTAWGALQYDPTATPAYSCLYIPFPSVPKCNGAGQVLQYTGGPNGTYSCVTVTPPPNCNKPWQSLMWSTSTASWSCPNTPYVFAGGVAHPATTNSSSFWADDAAGTPVVSDEALAPWVNSAYGTYFLNRATICTLVKFTVPAGLPAGQIIAQGNLIYPGATNDGLWHDWPVSFIKLDVGAGPPTTSAYNGSAYACMSDAGNFAKDNQSVLINSEHFSWTIIFIPN